MLHYIASGNRLASVFPVFNHIPGINVASPVYGSSQSNDRQVQLPVKHSPSLCRAAHRWTATNERLPLLWLLKQLCIELAHTSGCLRHEYVIWLLLITFYSCKRSNLQLSFFQTSHLDPGPRSKCFSKVRYTLILALCAAGKLVCSSGHPGSTLGRADSPPTLQASYPEMETACKL